MLLTTQCSEIYLQLGKKIVSWQKGQLHKIFNKDKTKKCILEVEQNNKKLCLLIQITNIKERISH